MFRQWLPIKYLCLYSANADPPFPPPVNAHTVLAYTPPPSISVRIRGYMKERPNKRLYERDIFCESYQRTTFEEKLFRSRDIEIFAFL